MSVGRRVRTRHRRGDQHPRVVYPEHQVQQLREEKAAGRTYREIADAHGIPNWRYVQMMVLGLRR